MIIMINANAHTEHKQKQRKRASVCVEEREHRAQSTMQRTSREITLASASTRRAHFGCIFKTSADCATWLWRAFYIHIIIT